MNEQGWAERLGAELGAIERGTATRYESGRRAGPAGWSPAPEATRSPSGPIRKTAAGLQQSRLRGAHKPNKELANKALPPLEFTEDEVGS